MVRQHANQNQHKNKANYHCNLRLPNQQREVVGNKGFGLKLFSSMILRNFPLGFVSKYPIGILQGALMRPFSNFSV